MNFFMFNTGLKHTPDGERIYVAWDEKTAFFVDRDRMICGQVLLDGEQTQPQVKKTVLDKYDRMEYYPAGYSDPEIRAITSHGIYKEK